MPWAIAWRGEAICTSTPSRRITPASAGCTPNNDSAISVRPDPTRPAKPSTSPWRTANVTSSKAPWRPSPSTLRATSPGSCGTRRKKSESSRPTMSRISVTSVTSPTGFVEMCWPSRRTVIRSLSLNTSSRRWLTNRMATPDAASRRTWRNRRSTSRAERAAVGSSMISTRTSRDSALAISTACWPATVSCEASARGSMSTSRPARIAAARCCIDRQCTSCPPGWPMKMFSATERSGNTSGSW